MCAIILFPVIFVNLFSFGMRGYLFHPVQYLTQFAWSAENRLQHMRCETAHVHLHMHIKRQRQAI